MMSFGTPLWWDVQVTVPSSKALLVAIFFYTLPPIFCYIVMAVLTVMPGTRTIRIALCPMIIFLALRASIPMDKSLKSTYHHRLAFIMLGITTRALRWASAKEPLVRHLRPGNTAPSTLLDALDLIVNLRGYGWEWSRGVYIPREVRPSDRGGFVLSTALSAVIHVILGDMLHVFIRSSLTNSTFHESLLFFHLPINIFFPGPRHKFSGSIFDDSLRYYPRILRSYIVSILVLTRTYAGLQAGYDLCALNAVLFLGHNPSQWPPVFDAPWRATSLTEFWGRRWHQLFREVFLIQGGYPLSFILGRTGIVIGAFFSSAVFHIVSLIPLDDEIELWRSWIILVGYELLAVGIIIEQIFRYVTGRKVRGIIGRFWTLTWTLLAGQLIVEGYMRSGMVGCAVFIDLVPPIRVYVERLAAGFDTLLHML